MTQSGTTPDLYSDATLDDLLAIAEKKYEIAFEPVSAAGVTLEIAQIANMRELLDKTIKMTGLTDAIHTLPLWAKIWPASLILGHYLRHLPLDTTSILEVGAGCGVTGLIAAALGCKTVWITDIDDDALLFARINVLKNNLASSVTVARADICKTHLNRRFSHIIGSEILYLEHLYEPLVTFLVRHLQSSSQLNLSPEIILASDHRRKADRFFQLVKPHYKVSQRHIGAKETSESEGTEKHLLTLFRLVPYSS